MYLIDAGPPADGLIIRQGKDVKRLNGVFITHMHEDHAGSLPGIVKCLNRHPYEDQHTHFVLPQRGGLRGPYGLVHHAPYQHEGGAYLPYRSSAWRML